MTTIQLYRKHKAGEVSRKKFLYEVRKDKNLPWVTNITSYDDAVKILKNKGIISELEKPTKIYQDDQWETDFMSDLKANMVDPNQADEIVAKAKESMKDHGETLKGMYKMFARPFASRAFLSDFAPEQRKKEAISEVDANVATDPAVDVVNPYFLKRGVNKMLSKEEELTNDSYIKALNKAAKMLQKNPHAFDDEMFANNEDVKKADEKLEMEDVKKANLNDKDNEMKKVKVKSLKEAALEELTNSLKKKDAINEDSHWYHTVGSEVHTPEGPGTVKEIIGGTLTVELKDGQLKDYQINTITHHTQKANEVGQNPEPEKQEPSKDDVKDMWAKWDKEGHKAFGGMVGDPEQFKKPLDMDKIKQYMERFKDDKEKMGKLKEVLKKIKEAGEKTALVTTSSGQTTAVDYKTDDELKSIGDNTDVRSVKTGMGRKIKGN